MLALTATGCEHPNVGSSESQLATVVENNAATSGSQDGAIASGDGGLLLFEHDFGVVRPNDRVTHTFSITNHSTAPWTLRHVDRTCVCTVAKCPKVILPGGVAEVEIEYRAGGTTADDRRAVDLYFHEPDAPAARFEVQVAIRAAIAPSRKELVFRGSGKSYAAEDDFEVENFSGGDWESLIATTDAPWASASAAFCRTEEDALGAHQVWRVYVRVDASGLSAARHKATLALRANGEESGLPLWLELAGPVTAIPQRLFFGNIDAEGKGTCSVQLICAACTAEELIHRLVVHHDLGECLRLTRAVRSSKVLQLSGTLQLPEDSSSITGSVVLEIGDADGTRIDLPVVGER